jgi:hypothetical protein
MPAIAKMIGSLALELLMTLITKEFLKKIIILVLEKVVKKTESDIDDKVLAAAKEAWEKEEK